MNLSATAPRQLAARSNVQSQRTTAFLLATLALWLLATLGIRPLLLPDEGRYSNVAREMLLGDGLLPTLNGLPFFHKPPLTYWVDMAAMHVFGVTPFAVRFAPFLGAWLMGASLFLALRRWVGWRPAAVTLGVLATSPFFYLGSQYANLDMLVAGTITVAVLSFVRAVEAPQRTDLRWLLGAWAACALAMLAKGLIGFVLPALIVGPWLLAQGRWRQMLGLLHPAGLLLFTAIAAPWFVAMQLRFPGFFDYFFIEQHFRRFAQSNFNNVQPFWFYIGVLPLLTLPWCLWLPRAGAAPQFRTEPGSVTAPAGLHWLWMWWACAVLGFFSLPSSKLVGYAMPALAPLCALVGLAVARGRIWRWLLPTSGLLCVGIVLALAWSAPNSHRDVAHQIAARLQASDRVAFMGEAFYDIPFYAQLNHPAISLEHWDDPEIPLHDNWRKEFWDAARFDADTAAQVLWTPDRLPALRCGPGHTWLVMEKNEQPPSALGTVTQVFGGENANLWRVEPGQDCPHQ